MSNKRMFSAKIVDSDAFLDMPQTSQLLYFHLAMRVDDDGFVGNPKKIMRMIGSADNDLSVLLGKKFIIGFESGIIVIKHHRMNNNWDSHNCKRTQYLDEFSQLHIKENGAYTLDKKDGLKAQSEYSLISDGKQSLEENRIDKNRIEENRPLVIKRGNSSLKKEKILDIETLPNWLDKEVWNNWVSYKKEKREKLTDNTIKLQLKELAKDIPNHKLIIEQSIRNGWKGLFPIKNLKQTNKLLEVTDKYDKYENNK